MATANEENRSPSLSDRSKMDANSDAGHNSPSKRRALADVSPNVKISSTTPMFMRKAMAGSPLKRSFTAAMDGGEGFTYLKRRRLDDSEALSEVAEGRLTPVAERLSTRESLDTSTPGEPDRSPTEPNTPTEEGDSSTQGSSTERKSFSSLINYDPSSQTSNAIFKTISDAELLRLRLRVAMYKVRTNQTDIPFSEIQVENALPPKTPTQQAIEDAVAELRREAQEVAAREPRPSVPKLLPAPVLRPTAYSSRFIYETDLPNSPPMLSPDKLRTARGVATPLRQIPRMANSPSSVQNLELTSSVIKGRVAEGLLGLRHAI